ncbi:MAG: apolipoprotein A1/A4/E family protein [bacterium]|nr:apolipoprotein A1/A4/E family protein [bacterium]
MINIDMQKKRAIWGLAAVFVVLIGAVAGGGVWADNEGGGRGNAGEAEVNHQLREAGPKQLNQVESGVKKDGKTIKKTVTKHLEKEKKIQKRIRSKEIKEHRQELRKNLQERRQEWLEKAKKRAEKRREKIKEAKEKLRERESEFKERLRKIKDERKKKIVERIKTRLVKLNAKLVERLNQAADKMSLVAEKIRKRAKIWEGLGVDMSQVYTRLDTLEIKIDAFKAKLDEQETKVYIPQITDGVGLRRSVGQTYQQLRSDFQTLRREMIEIRAELVGILQLMASLKPAASLTPTQAVTGQTGAVNNINGGF